MLTLILSSKDSSKLTFSIFHFVPFINHDVFPCIFIKFLTIFEDEIIGCQAHIPFGCFHLLEDFSSGCRAPSINNFLNCWRPFFKLVHPV